MAYTELDRYRVEKFLYRRVGWTMKGIVKHLIRNGVTRAAFTEIIRDVKREGFRFIEVLKAQEGA